MVVEDMYTQENSKSEAKSFTCTIEETITSASCLSSLLGGLWCSRNCVSKD
jgi:hypothetical protein